MIGRVTRWMPLLFLVGIPASAYAEEVTIATYSPSPRGVYRELRRAPQDGVAAMVRSGFRDVQIAADLAREEVVDLGVARD